VFRREEGRETIEEEILNKTYLHNRYSLQICHVFRREEGRKTLEEEILDCCCYRIHSYIQAIQVNILQN
jgi:hypothetical protein